MIKKVLVFFGTNEVILGIASIMGIVGFLMTVYVTLKTANISKILRFNQTTALFNKERAAFLKSFKGHLDTIIVDGIKTDQMLKSILESVESYRSKFGEIMSLQEKMKLSLFVRLLKKEASQVNFNKVCNYLAYLSGRLTKKEEQKNG